MNLLPCPLMAVTDRTLCAKPLETQVERIFAGGGRWLWFRDKDLPRIERKELAQCIMLLANRFGATVSIGGDADMAAELDALAAHVSTPRDVEYARNRMGPAALIGMSAHSIDDAKDAASAGADYITLSPIFLTASKPGYGPALGTDAITEAARTGLQVVALGGVNHSALTAVRSAGASGAAMMGSIMQSNDPAAFVSDFFAQWDRRISAP